MPALVSEYVVKFLDTASSEKEVIDDIYVSRINILRFLAICSIVWGHCFIITQNTVYKSIPYIHADVILEQMGKMGTINFFLISGFLLANKINKLNLIGYLNYRKFSVILPWITFLAFFVIAQLLQVVFSNPSKSFHPVELLRMVASTLKNSWIYTAYWFIPVTIFSGCVLVLLKNQLNKLWLIVLLIFISLFYSINLYYGWIGVQHTKAIFGFLFFFWLGLQIRNHFEWFKSFMDRLSWKFLLPLFLLFFVLACIEGAKLRAIGCEDAYASIRISNIGLSFILFLSVLKFKNVKWIDFWQPQKYVYGVYLVHTIIIFELKPFVSRFVEKQHLDRNAFALLFIQLAFFVIIFILSYLIVVLIKNSRIRFIIGKQ